MEKYVDVNIKTGNIYLPFQYLFEKLPLMSIKWLLWPTKFVHDYMILVAIQT